MENIPIFEHFWLITAVLVGFGNAIMFKINSFKQIAVGNITSTEANKLIVWWLVCVVVPCVGLWYLQSSSGQPFQIDFMVWESINKYLAVILVSILWAALLVWVFVYNGASKLVKLATLSHSGTSYINLKTSHIKLVVLLAVSSGIIALFIPRS